MEYMFPRPSKSIVEKNEKNLIIRILLFMLIIFSLAIAIWKFIEEGVKPGLYYLVIVWLAYASWASLYFCNILM